MTVTTPNRAEAFQSAAVIVPLIALAVLMIALDRLLGLSLAMVATIGPLLLLAAFALGRKAGRKASKRGDR